MRRRAHLRPASAAVRAGRLSTPETVRAAGLPASAAVRAAGPPASAVARADRRLLLWAALAAALLVALGGPPAAVADADAATLRAERPETGWIALTVSGAPGTAVVLTEDTDAGPRELTRVVLTAGVATVRRAARWSCASRVRRFTATTAAAGTGGPVPADPSTPAATPPTTATATITTPSCADRFAVAHPSRITSGAPATVTVRDRWRVGDAAAQLCSGPADATPACVPVALPAGRVATRVRLRPRTLGRWTVELRAPEARATSALVVAPRGRLRVLATGDSMIQLVDGLLGDDLGPGAVVRSDAHISTGISKPFMLDWPALARRQARDRPDATVVFLGANDGFPLDGVACCSDAWVRAYADRVEGMMRSYRRDGAARVYWVLLPPPRPAAFARVFEAVDAAARAAQQRVGAGVRLIDVGAVVAPGGRFRATIRRGGRAVTVRQADGIHLSVPGAAIAAELIAAAMRRDGLA